LISSSKLTVTASELNARQNAHLAKACAVMTTKAIALGDLGTPARVATAWR